jgi:hypothetical protein
MWSARFLVRGAICSRTDCATPAGQACLNNFFLPKAESRYAAELGIDRAADYAAYVRAIVNTKITRNEVFGSN